MPRYEKDPTLPLSNEGQYGMELECATCDRPIPPKWWLEKQSRSLEDLGWYELECRWYCPQCVDLTWID